MQFTLQLITLVGISVVGAIISMWIIGIRPKSLLVRKTAENDETGAVELTFSDDRLEHATSAARQCVPGLSDDYLLSDLVAGLEGRFPDLNTILQELPESKSVRLAANDGLGHASLHWVNGKTKVTLDTRTDIPPIMGIDPKCVVAMEEELETLRATAKHAPFLVWRENAEGKIVWANSAYMELVEKSASQQEFSVWPPANIFPDYNEDDIDLDGKLCDRVRVAASGSALDMWFFRRMVRIGADRLFLAYSADETVRAEEALEEFVQTLTNTFAHLTSGLAIFDKHRKLALFNPALGELTHLKPEFLMLRPTLQAFLDKLRDKRMIPEPRDYRSWRQRMYEVETAARDGLFEESWVLPGGQTYRVTGRPHPDGALAFTFEDKSAEISVTRRFRAQIDVGQAVIDGLNEGIAVFSAAGTLTLSNAAFADLWGADFETAVAPVNIVEATRRWAEKCAPSPTWGDIREFACSFGERAEWSSELRLTDGRGLVCRVQPLSGGNTLVGFTEEVAHAAKVQPPQSNAEIFETTNEQASA